MPSNAFLDFCVCRFSRHCHFGLLFISAAHGIQIAVRFGSWGQPKRASHKSASKIARAVVIDLRKITCDFYGRSKWLRLRAARKAVLNKYPFEWNFRVGLRSSVPIRAIRMHFERNSAKLNGTYKIRDNFHQD